MSKVKRPCFARTVSLAVIVSILGLNFVVDPAFAQSTETTDGVTVEKNSDGSVEAYDAGESSDVSDGAGGTMQGDGQGRIHYRPGTSPYQKKFSDGTTVRRNSDGSIETWDEGETHHYAGGTQNSGSHKRAVKRKAVSKSKATTTAKKK